MKPIQVLHWFQETFHYYVVFTNSIFFILGLIFSYKLVEKTFLNILITRLADAWQVYDLRRAVVVVSMLDGTSSILVAFFAYLADVYTGRFTVLLFSASVCIIGLLLNSLSTGNDDNGQLNLKLFYPALALMALAQAAQTVTLQEFLDDQLRVRDPAASAADNEEERRRHTKFWWTLVSFAAAIFAQFGPLAGFHFRKLAQVLIGVVGGCFFVFLLGTKCFIFVATIQNPFKDVGIVICRAIANRNLDNSNADLSISPHVPWLRWLDRAAIVREMEEAAGVLSVEQVRRVKLLLHMLPLCTCFLALGMVDAAGSTLFFEEAVYIYGKADERLIIFFANLVRFTDFVVSETSSYALRKLRERTRYKKQKMEVVRIGMGMMCSVACCIVAWATETHRQQWASDSETKSRAFWLVPQFFLLGLVGGLSGSGLQSLYESQGLFRFGAPFQEILMGVGRFMSIICIVVFSGRHFQWFQIDIDDSRLDRYYIFLAVLTSGNVVIYCCVVACCYGDDAFLREEEVEVDGPRRSVGGRGGFGGPQPPVEPFSFSL